MTAIRGLKKMPLALSPAARAGAPVDTLNLHAIASAHNFLLLHSWRCCVKEILPERQLGQQLVAHLLLSLSWFETLLSRRLLTFLFNAAIKMRVRSLFKLFRIMFRDKAERKSTWRQSITKSHSLSACCFASIPRLIFSKFRFALVLKRKKVLLCLGDVFEACWCCSQCKLVSNSSTVNLGLSDLCQLGLPRNYRCFLDKWNPL